jgi:hypothetical protein
MHPSDVIVKRTHSHGGEHVRYPAPNPGTRMGTPGDPGIWFSQEYILTLHKLGEIRVFYLNGKYMYTVSSYLPEDATLNEGVHDAWHSNIVLDLPTLAEQERYLSQVPLPRTWTNRHLGLGNARDSGHYKAY